ncbi:MAG TPA: DUF4229 domain-containing protein [Actinomycetales bacterium]|nr:DUF4229 domain-containing protein [Actinomycetales bacterium]
MSDRDETTEITQDTHRPRPGARLARNMVFYTILRLLLVLLITLAIIGIGLLFDVQVPILVAAILAVVIALPLSMVLFTRLRAEINSDITAVDAGRREKREDLRRRMDEA